MANGQPATAATLQSDFTAVPPPTQSSTITTNFNNPATNVLVETGTTLNLAPGDPTGAGQSLSLRAGAGTANNGNYIQFSVSTLGLQDLSLTYATRSTPTGFLTQTLSYSLDGINFTTDGSFTATRDSTFRLATFDLSSYNTIGNQATVYLRIIFTGATNPGGTTQLDNIQLTSVPEPTTMAGGALALAAVAYGQRRRFGKLCRQPSV